MEESKKKKVIFFYRQYLFIPDSPSDREVHDAVVCTQAAHR